ncbi:BBE domain-containing protein, partial [bacterium]|nr:BBE domain-containing protein [bacterium]
EGFSLSPGLVIDIREMNSIEINGDASSAVIGGGALLGNVYETVAQKGVVVPAGTCPTVGITGHTTGGGYGLLTRPLGLACDSLLSAQLIDARGQLISANENENPDLFWALRGGGSGSFGVITSIQFKTHQIRNVTTFIVRWRVGFSEASQIASLWQQWAPQAPNGITALLNCTMSNNQIQLTLVGQSITTQSKLKAEIKTNFLDQVQSPPVIYKITPKTFMEAVKQFAGGSTPYYIKGKSDYVKQVHSEEALNAIFSQMPLGVSVIFDAYGGAIRNKSDSETAFAHRENTICSIQYYLQWENTADSNKNLTLLRKYYDGLRPYMSGHAYFNYCDLDLGETYARAYWGNNLEKLVAVKNAYDPDHLFTHAQGIPKKV